MHHRTQWRYQSRNFEEAQLKQRTRLLVCVCEAASRASPYPMRGSEHLIAKWVEKNERRNRILDAPNMKTFGIFFYARSCLRCAQNSAEEGLNVANT